MTEQNKGQERRREEEEEEKNEERKRRLDARGLGSINATAPSLLQGVAKGPMQAPYRDYGGRHWQRLKRVASQEMRIANVREIPQPTYSTSIFNYVRSNKMTDSYIPNEQNDESFLLEFQYKSTTEKYVYQGNDYPFSLILGKKTILGLIVCKWIHRFIRSFLRQKLNCKT